MAPSKSSKASKDSKDSKDSKGNHRGGASSRPLLAAKIVEVRDTYGKMSAKARGVRIHTGPLELRKALEPRDTTEWVRSMKQPYSTLEPRPQICAYTRVQLRANFSRSCDDFYHSGNCLWGGPGSGLRCLQTP
ncbi:TR1 [Symbiodinium natans]|uniref:TR1 protein n=1 Tax=Symbiodinium natans TaxID=878477 RepID=A0A812TYY1_9DINO|nr:TR1 [Symbiodinium natans]